MTRNWSRLYKDLPSHVDPRLLCTLGGILPRTWVSRFVQKVQILQTSPARNRVCRWTDCTIDQSKQVEGALMQCLPVRNGEKNMPVHSDLQFCWLFRTMPVIDIISACRKAGSVVARQTSVARAHAHLSGTLTVHFAQDTVLRFSNSCWTLLVWGRRFSCV